MLSWDVARGHSQRYVQRANVDVLSLSRGFAVDDRRGDVQTGSELSSNVDRVDEDLLVDYFCYDLLYVESVQIRIRSRLFSGRFGKKSWFHSLRFILFLEVRV